MTGPAHLRIEALYHAAMAIEPGERADYLAQACGEDRELRREVESLLRAGSRATGFIAGPAIDDVARALAGDDVPLTGCIGSYEIEALLGRGGMGEVYLARDRRLDRQVAVKLLQPRFTSHADVVRRFEQEARAASSLNHPNIVTIHEFGEVAGRRFLAMEFVQGRSLAAPLGRPMSLTTVADIGAQAARALAVAHAAGIVHRDIKPENMMLRDDGYVKLLDFGLARLTTADGAGTESAPQLVVGTPRYMSPEQARGERPGTASDVFSLGVLLYELATAIHPFPTGSPLAVLHAIAAPEPVRLNPDSPLPPRLLALLRRMLAKTASDRPSADDVDRALRLVASDDGSRAAGQSPRPLEGRGPSLPLQRTPFVGRADELRALQSLMGRDRARLVTLTGPGGTGKTRLALQFASAVVDQFAGGVAFVDCAPITDSGLVASTIASVLGVRETGERTFVEAIAERLVGDGHVLLVVDNFEQVASGAGLLRTLLDACPSLALLVTSRVLLHLSEEQGFSVPPLSLPGPGSAAAPHTMMAYGAVELFVQRARSARAGFDLTEANGEAVAAICRRLDGLPLAIELAAARIKILPPGELLPRLERRLDLLTGGPRDAPERQQTLRRAIRWSYDLLTPAEQTLFRRMSVFAGGCTLEAVEAVCNAREDLAVDVLDGVTALVDSSLLVQRVTAEGDSRLTMLETFREYARAELASSGEAADVQRAHAAYMLVLAEEETLEMPPAERDAWLRRCDVEHDNYRAAVTHLVASGEAEWALRLGAALFRFWEQREHLTEGAETLLRVLQMPGAQAATRPRARALYLASMLGAIQVDFALAEALSHEACAIYRAVGDTRAVASVMVAMAWQAQRRGKTSDATVILEDAIGLWQQLGEATAVDLARSNMATIALLEGEGSRAGRLFEDVAASAAARGDIRMLASALNGLGEVALSQGRDVAARDYHMRSLATYRSIEDHWGVAGVLADLANLDVETEAHGRAQRTLVEALRAFQRLGHQRGVARQLELLCWCAGCEQRYVEAVRLASAAASIRRRIGTRAKPRDEVRTAETLAAARRHLPGGAYDEAWQSGRTEPLDHLVAS